jgi:alpha-glucosidase
VLAHAPLGQPAIYVRANTPVPLWAPMAHDPLTWLVFVAAAEAGQASLYEDSGDGYAFEHGQFGRTSAICRVAAGTIALEFGAQAGAFDPVRETVELDVRGVDRPGQILVDGIAITTWDHADGRLVVRLPSRSAARTVEIRAASV